LFYTLPDLERRISETENHMTLNSLLDRGNVVLGALLALGLIIGGWVLGAEIKATRLGDRYVTVKGLVERKVKSDLALWPLT
jgi:hypothetical protein